VDTSKYEGYEQQEGDFVDVPDAALEPAAPVDTTAEQTVPPDEPEAER
jgi:hypothetical protein